VTPVLCLISDRLRLGPDWETTLVERVGAAARAGVHLIQVRERDLEGGDLLRLVRRCAQAVAGTRARLIVNDRIDVAISGGAHGVHLRADSMSPRRARAMAPRGFLVGRSVHGTDEARLVGGSGAVDYLIFGHVFDSQSKPGEGPVGVRALEAAVTATTAPVLAVGGITVARAAAIAATGAAGIAAIGLFSEPALEALPAAVAAVSSAFDTRRGVT
jgi:thiamine-phosphate diphosphorylase